MEATRIATINANASDRREHHQLPIGELMDRASSKGQGSALVDVVAPLASLLVLRWAAFMEAEHEAIASFDDASFSPGLPATLRQPAWADPEQLSTHVVDASLKLGRSDVSHLKYAGAVAPLVRESAKRDPELLRLLVSWVSGLSVQTPGGRVAAAAAFDDLLARVVQAKGKFGGEYTTPHNVVELMVQLVEPRPGDRVYDPCFGVGGLLVEAARQLQAVATMMEASNRGKNVRSNGIFGVEINAAAFAIGLCRIVMAGIEQPGLELGDALERPLPRNRSAEGFDCIVAVPPWGGKISDTRKRQYPVPTGDIENLFLQHVMASLRPSGRAVIAVPEATLFRTGPDRLVRKTLLSEFRVDVVVSLPEGAFAPATSISSSLVLFRREPPRSDVRFVRIPSNTWRSRAETALREVAAVGQRSEEGAELGQPHGVASAGAEPDHAQLESPRVLRDLPAIVGQQRSKSLQARESVGFEVWDTQIKKLASRDFELLAKPTGAAVLEATLERLRAADAGLKIVSLGEVAHVVAGASYERELTTDQSNSEEVLAPLVRVADVASPNVRRPALFFTKRAAPGISEAHWLRRGDLLLTTSGTVGKVGLVDEALEGAVATKSLAVIRLKASVTSDFLAAILRARAYQEWFTGHARGATIQHLSIRTLRTLPIPITPLPVQDAVLRNLSGGSDALASLVRYISGATSDPLAAWLERPAVLTLLTEKVASLDAARSLSDAGNELLALRTIRNRVVHSYDRIWDWQSTSRSSALADWNAVESWTGLSSWPAAFPASTEPVGQWLMHAVELASLLKGIDAVPSGAPRLAALEMAKTRLEAAQRVLANDESPVAARLRLITSTLVRLSESATVSMLEKVSIAVRVEPNEVSVGVPTEVHLHVRNDSPVGLKSVRVSTKPDLGSGGIAYIAETGSVAVPLTINAGTSAQPLRIEVRWSGYRLDGTPVNGLEEVEILVRSTREVVRAGDLGASPYIVGNPVDREEMFFGRADIIERIRRQLASSTNANIILLEGNRRTGKTSVLKQLQEREAPPGWLIIYCNFQEAEGDPTRAGISTRDVYRFLARAIGWTLFGAGIRTWFPGQPSPNEKRPFPSEFLIARDRAITDEHPFEMFELYLNAVIEAARPQRVLLMLDEFDKLHEGIDAGVTSPQVPENLRHILQHHRGLSAILTGSRRLKRLREDYWSALFGLGYRVGISSLPIEDAQRLVTEPVAGRLNYLPQARDRVVALCAAQPFLVQSLCNRIFDQAASTGERAITVARVEEAAVEMVRDNEHFRTLWDYAETHRRRLLLALCERLAEDPDAVTLDFLATQLESLGIQIPSDTALGDDLEYLRELELIEFDTSYRGGTYRIAVPLLGIWIRESIDFEHAVARAKEEAQLAQS